MNGAERGHVGYELTTRLHTGLTRNDLERAAGSQIVEARRQACDSNIGIAGSHRQGHRLCRPKIAELYVETFPTVVAAALRQKHWRGRDEREDGDDHPIRGNGRR